MKFAVALTMSVAAAVTIQEPAYGYNISQKPSFSIGQHYTKPDYTQEYGEVLPGADFNKQVYEFDEDKMIWDQNDYVERTRQEAELMVALEALKSTISYLNHDLAAIAERITFNRNRIGANQEDVWESHAEIKQQY